MLVWDLQADGTATNPRQLPGHSGGVWSVAFSPDGQLLASHDSNKKVLVWCTKVMTFSKKLNESGLKFKSNVLSRSGSRSFNWETQVKVEFGGLKVFDGTVQEQS